MTNLESELIFRNFRITEYIKPIRLLDTPDEMLDIILTSAVDDTVKFTTLLLDKRNNNVYTSEEKIQVKRSTIPYTRDLIVYFCKCVGILKEGNVFYKSLKDIKEMEKTMPSELLYPKFLGAVVDNFKQQLPEFIEIAKFDTFVLEIDDYSLCRFYLRGYFFKTLEMLSELRDIHPIKECKIKKSTSEDVFYIEIRKGDDNPDLEYITMKECKIQKGLDYIDEIFKNLKKELHDVL